MLDLKVVSIHPRQETIKCPHCGVEGQNHGTFPPRATLPATCKKCTETFMVKVMDISIDRTFESLSLTIKGILNSYINTNNTDATVAMIQDQINCLIRTYTNFDEIPEVMVTRDKNMLVLVASNNAGIRLLEVLSASTQGLESDNLVGV